MRSGVDNSAMQIAYYVWDKTNGDGLAALPEYINSSEVDDMQRIRNVVNDMLGVKYKSTVTTTGQVAREQDNSLFGLNTQNQEQLEFHVNTLNVVSKFLENVGTFEFLSQDGTIVDGALLILLKELLI